MQAELRLFATLKKLLPTKNSTGTIITIEEGTKIDNLVDLYKIPRDIKLIVLVNGKKVNEDYIICENDRIGIFPPVGGG